MLTIKTSALHAAPGDAAARAGSAGAAPMAGADPAGFASLLRQTQTQRVAAPAAPPGPLPAPNPAPRAAASPDATPAPKDAAAPNEPEPDAAPESNDPASRTRALARSRLRATDALAPTRDAKAGPAGPGAADIANTAEAVERHVADAPTEAGDAPQPQLVATGTPIDPGLMHWLAGLQRAVSGQADETPADGHGKSASGDTDTDTASIDTRRQPRGQRPADLKADAELKNKAAQGQTRLADAASASGFAGVLAEQRSTENANPPLVSASPGAKEAAAAAASVLAPAPGTGTEAAPPAAVVIAAAVTSPDFAQELGLRLVVLAKDGVQTAELHLNPAEMGPVSVQIVMDGTQARVDFGADMAATRAAIEAGLPGLASALAEAGFTLAGGGVSQHAGGRGDGGTPQGRDPARARGRLVEAQAAGVATAARRIVTQGGVDLFA